MRFATFGIALLIDELYVFVFLVLVLLILILYTLVVRCYCIYISKNTFGYIRLLKIF
jgi:hypothetical protein